MSVALYTHPSCLEHNPGPGHPESPARLAAVLEALQEPDFALLDRLDAPRATCEQLERVHRGDFIDEILGSAPHAGWHRLDADTLMSPASGEAALRAAGAVCAAVDGAVAGWNRRAFCAVRPPGHHATSSTAMGFCLFNNVAVGAAHAIAAHGLQRIAIVDFDVHHGNGTQDIFRADPRVLYASSHQWPLYPGTGARGETGVGNIVNAPLPSGSGSKEFRGAWEDVLLPALEAFRPQLLMISAGFDAHRLDPLANLALERADYAWITHRLVDLAQRHAYGRVVSSLEGGYSLTALRECAAAHVAALMA
ncbi:histone deacetylase family protein [Dokdonella soli]|uniref:Histone deacetylase family protein n=1 Tax=Dokdonella soli TaxID=529810 RepID=A0ABN1IVF7_9GAMM